MSCTLKFHLISRVLSPPIHHTMTMCHTLIFLTFSMLGSAAQLRQVFPGLFATLAVPKTEELVALAYRHQNKEAAQIFFMDGMTRAMHQLAEQVHPAFPVTIYYAFKQSD